MPKKAHAHIRSHVVGYIALFIALSGTAYAANTVGSVDVINDSLLSEDLKNNAAVGTNDVVNDSVPGGGLRAVDLAATSVGTSEVANNSLTGTDIIEATLSGAGPVQDSGRVTVNDAVGGTPTDTAALIDTGKFTIKGRCDDQGAAGVGAQVVIQAASGSYAAASNELNLGSTSGENNLMNESVTPTLHRQVFTPYSAIANGAGGDVIQGTLHVVTKSQGTDCVFGATGIGT